MLHRFKTALNAVTFTTRLKVKPSQRRVSLCLYVIDSYPPPLLTQLVETSGR